MMTKIEKKEAFLQIVENWFEDLSEDINVENCIGFYKHLILSLKFESKVSVNSDRNFFIKSVFDLLFTFDEKLENKEIPIESIIGKKAIEQIVNETAKCQYVIMWNELKQIYQTCKDEYLLK